MVASCYPSGVASECLVIHTDGELFTISVDNWTRMMVTVLAQRQRHGSEVRPRADE